MVPLADKSVLLPSVVKVSEDGTLTAGDPGHPDDDPTGSDGTSSARVGDPTPLMIAGQPHSAVSLMAATLKSVIATLTAAEGEPPSEVVLTYPAVWGPYRREHFIEVPRQAGVENITVLTEPEAAASHYAARQQLANGDVVAVYDLGGGTFDTAVARKTKSGVEIIGVPEGVEWVGGIDFDEAVLAMWTGRSAAPTRVSTRNCRPRRSPCAGSARSASGPRSASPGRSRPTSR